MGPDGYEIWEIYLLYLRTLGTEEAAKEYDSLIHELARQHHPQFNVIKANILELQAVMVSIKRARKTYRLFIKNYSNCLEVHERMADLESKQVIENFDFFFQKCVHLFIFYFM